MTQLTSVKKCKQKHTYTSQGSATKAKKRRNKAWGYDYLWSYQCNVCQFWHVTSQIQEKQMKDEIADAAKELMSMEG